MTCHKSIRASVRGVARTLFTAKIGTRITSSTFTDYELAKNSSEKTFRRNENEPEPYVLARSSLKKKQYIKLYDGQIRISLV